MPVTGAPKKSKIGIVILTSLLAGAAMVGLQLYTPRSVAEVEATPLNQFVAHVVLYLGMAFVGAIVLGILAGIAGTIAKKSFSQVLGSTYALSIIPLVLGLCGWDYLAGRNTIKEDGKSQTYAVAYESQWNKFYEEEIKTRLGAPRVTRQQANDMMDGLKDDLNKLNEAMIGEDGLPQKADVTFETKTPTNEAEKMRAAIQGYFKDMVAQQNNYLEELNKAGLEVLLSADRISKKDGFEESYKMLADIRLVVKRNKDKAHQLIVGMPERIDQMDVAAATKASMKMGFNKNLGNTLPMFEENWKIETDIIELFADAIDLVRETQPHWEVQNGQFMFEKDADLARFNAIMEKVNQGAARQEEIRKKSMEAAASKFDSLR